MREPSTDAKWDWWLAAVETGEAARVEREPQVGFYKVRRWPRSQYWLPARIWLEPGEIDPETGELMSDERLCAEIDGERKNPMAVWLWLHPISQEDYEWLTASRPLQPRTRPTPKSRR